jgi:TPR repeat protein
MSKVSLMKNILHPHFKILVTPSQWKSMTVQGVVISTAILLSLIWAGIETFDQRIISTSDPQYNSQHNLEKRAQKGETEAQFLLGNLYFAGSSQVPRNDAKAIALYKKAGFAGNPKAQYQMALILQNANDDAGAFDWFKRAADNNVTAALTRTGMYYVKGTGLTPPNGEVAASYFYRAAEKGDSTAMHNLAHLCMNGAGIPKNEGAALYWMILASAVENNHKIKEQMNLTQLEWKAKINKKVSTQALSDATKRLAKGFKDDILAENKSRE